MERLSLHHHQVHHLYHLHLGADALQSLLVPMKEQRKESQTARGLGTELALALSGL